HTMHGGDIKGQITEEKRTNVACTQCHAELADPTTASQHSKHAPDSPGNSCYSCHMPEVVYGVQAIHKTHQIGVPEPQLTIEQNVPNACNQCHIEKSANWAVIQAKAMWPDHYGHNAASPHEQFDIAEGIRGLFGGDALTRALMADAMFKHGDPKWAAPFLIEAFSGDNYPIVRYFAANALANSKVADIAKPDYLGSAQVRTAHIAPWEAWADQTKLAAAAASARKLRASRKDVDLEVGE
ncbi:MAG: cytochrome c3 family protein, partial [Pyrinomonadaceae bacterium]